MTRRTLPGVLRSVCLIIAAVAVAACSSSESRSEASVEPELAEWFSSEDGWGVGIRSEILALCLDGEHYEDGECECTVAQLEEVVPRAEMEELVAEPMPRHRSMHPPEYDMDSSAITTMCGRESFRSDYLAELQRS